MNNRSYTKLFSSIVTSSMWSEDSDTRIVWVTMLSLCNEYGECLSSVPGLARTANVDIEKCQSALTIFQSPDEHSRTKDFDGRRIKEIQGGWKLLNYELYRDMMSLEERREYKRIKESERRTRLKAIRGQDVDKRGHSVDECGQNVALRGQNLAEVEAKAKVNKKLPSLIKISDEEFIDKLKSNPAYQSIDISKEMAKMDVWLLADTGRRKTRKFMVNWLNRIETPISLNVKKEFKPQTTEHLREMEKQAVIARVEAEKNGVRHE